MLAAQFENGFKIKYDWVEGGAREQKLPTDRDGRAGSGRPLGFFVMQGKDSRRAGADRGSDAGGRRTSHGNPNRRPINHTLRLLFTPG